MSEITSNIMSASKRVDQHVKNKRTNKYTKTTRGGEDGHTALFLRDGAVTAVCLSRPHNAIQQYMSVEGLWIPGHRLYLSTLKT